MSLDQSMLTNQYGTAAQQPNNTGLSGISSGGSSGPLNLSQIPQKYYSEELPTSEYNPNLYIKGATVNTVGNISEDYRNKAYQYWTGKMQEYGKNDSAYYNNTMLDPWLNAGFDYTKLGWGGQSGFYTRAPNDPDTSLSYGKYREATPWTTPALRGAPEEGWSDPGTTSTGDTDAFLPRWYYPKEQNGFYISSKPKSRGFWKSMQGPASTALFLGSAVIPFLSPAIAALGAGALTYASQGGPTAENDTKAIVKSAQAAASAYGSGGSGYSTGGTISDSSVTNLGVKGITNLGLSGIQNYNTNTPTGTRATTSGSRTVQYGGKDYTQQQLINFLIDAASSGRYDKISNSFWDTYNQAFTGGGKPTQQQVLAYAKRRKG